MLERLRDMRAFTGARLGAAGMLFVALGSLPYSYYTLMRFAVCVIGGYGAFLASERQQKFWMWAFGVTALLFNPFVPVRLDRATWAILDLAAGVLFLASLRNRVLVGETIGESPLRPLGPEPLVDRPPSVAESHAITQSELSERCEAAAQRETERKRLVAEHERFKKWQERVYKK